MDRADDVPPPPIAAFDDGRLDQALSDAGPPGGGTDRQVGEVDLVRRETLASLAQCEQTLRNIESALREAGATMSEVVRVQYILPRREDFEPCWPVLKRAFGDIRPAATMIQAGLADPRMLIEIEVTARRGSGLR